jgi:ubiquinone/menaquinone biosynthesis C-methylase UbiE
MEYNSKSYAQSLLLGGMSFGSIWNALKPEPRKRILEIGCNQGLIVKKMRERGVDAQGIDINPQAIESACVKEVEVMDATSLRFEDSTFDSIYSAHTIEHIPNLVKALQEMARVVKKGGRILLIYPAEPIRGLFCMRSAFFLWQNPLKIHVHKLSPKRLINNFIPGIGLKHVKSEFSLFLPGPQYLTVLEKV